MKYFKILAIFIALAGLSSCTEWLKIEPEGKIVADKYWKSEQDVDKVVLTCYRSMLENDFVSRMIIWGELRSDNLIGTLSTSYDLKKVLEANILPTNPYTTWGSFYKVINYCNVVMHFAPTVIDPNFTEPELKAKLAEVMTLRAICYFYLVRAFKNVPLSLESANSDAQNYNLYQSTEDQVLDRLEADLLQAEGWAMNTYGTVKANKGRITKTAIRALLADIYLWRNKYPECIEYCDKVMEDQNLKIVEADEQPYFKIFGLGNSTESIFELQFDASNSLINGAVTNLYGSFSDANTYNGSDFAVPELMTDPANNKVFVVSKDVADATKTTDIRRKDFISPIQSNQRFVSKYVKMNRYGGTEGEGTYVSRGNSGTCNWIMYRLTDVMLMKAEALAELYKDDSDLPSLVYKHSALALVNKVFLRSNPGSADSLKAEGVTSKTQLQQVVAIERQRELMFEGKRWFDLLRVAKRTNSTRALVDQVVRKYTESSGIIRSKMTDMNALYWPISEAEMLANPNLKQNPYYSSVIEK